MDHAAAGNADAVDAAVAFARHVLPDQGPIGVFIHHNTLHAFQHQTFHDGVQQGARLLGCEPYLRLEQYREAFRVGRIEEEDLQVVLAHAGGPDATQLLQVGASRLAVWLLCMRHELETQDEAGLAFTVRAGTAAPCADRPLWNACVERTARGPHRALQVPQAPARHRDALLDLTGEDVDVAVHAELVRCCSTYVDQGQAHAVLPDREKGFLGSVAALYASGSEPAACPGVRADFAQVHDAKVPAGQLIRAALDALGVDEPLRRDYVIASLLALPGWAGMFARLEAHPDERHGAPPTSLHEFLAVRLMLERRAVERACARAQRPLAWPALMSSVAGSDAGSRRRSALLAAHTLWHVAHAAGLTPDAVRGLQDHALEELWRQEGALTPLLRRKLWHEAYERRYRRQILDAVAARREVQVSEPAGRPKAQFLFCIDEREESTRRALEEQDVSYETYGLAGFFGVAIDYQGLDDRALAAYCPVVVTPAHEVHEAPVYTDRNWHSIRRPMLAAWHALERGIGRLSRTLTGGAGVSLLLGPAAGAATAMRVVAPRASLELRQHFVQLLTPPPATRLLGQRHDVDAKSPSGKRPGFTVEEAADRVAAQLKNIGLTEKFAQVVVVLGHGSTSLNNPHESAHDCGACGGRRGGANARLFAEFANRTDVREAVKKRGVTIPPDCWFVGALHDTADDSVRYFDLDAVPHALSSAFDGARRALEQACKDEAQERCRRFEDAPLGISPDDALRHVQARSKHLAQPRPEYGHCTNAICVVGRRSLTRGLHLDRRAFLVSYDARIDEDHKIVERILAAVGPVGAGISLEYYFSSVDVDGFGCGTKLPHNVTGLVGVMNGHAGDLRTGLPLQMVEIHEPMRLLLIVEATREALLAVAARQAEVKELVVNRWVQLISLHPETGEMFVFEDGDFHPYSPKAVSLPRVKRSQQWHGRSRDHLPPALVTEGLAIHLGVAS